MFGWLEAGGRVPGPESDAAFGFADAAGWAHRAYRRGQRQVMPGMRQMWHSWLHVGLISDTGCSLCEPGVECVWCEHVPDRDRRSRNCW